MPPSKFGLPGAVHAKADPVEDKTYPFAPIPSLDSAVVPVAYNKSPIVYELCPVPPLAATRVPATLTAPLVAVLGVRPVDPNVIVVTPAAAAAPQTGTPPALTVRT